MAVSDALVYKTPIKTRNNKIGEIYFQQIIQPIHGRFPVISLMSSANLDIYHIKLVYLLQRFATITKNKVLHLDFGDDIL